MRPLLLILPLLLADAATAASTPVPASVGAARPGQSTPSAAMSIGSEDPRACGNSPKAQRLAELIRQHPLQRRLRLICHSTLARVAAAKAEEMAALGEVNHIYGVMAPNRRLRHAGYALPYDYPGAFHNQVEAVSGGFETPDEALEAFINSPAHRTHLLAEDPFYAEQDEIAVGYAQNPTSDHRDFWVVYIARHRDRGNPAPTLQSAAEVPAKGF